MIEVDLPVGVTYRFDRLDYFSVEPYEDWYEDEGEIEIDHRFAVVAWGLYMGCKRTYFCGRFIDLFDTKEKAIKLAARYAKKYNVSVE